MRRAGQRVTPRPAAVGAQDHGPPKQGPALLQVRSAGYRSKIWNTIWINAHIASRPSLPSLGGSGRRRLPVPRNTGLPHSHGTAPRQQMPVVEDAEEASEFGPGGHLTRDAVPATVSWRYRPSRRCPSAGPHGTGRAPLSVDGREIARASIPRERRRRLTTASSSRWIGDLQFDCRRAPTPVRPVASRRSAHQLRSCSGSGGMCRQRHPWPSL